MKNKLNWGILAMGMAVLIGLAAIIALSFHLNTPKPVKTDDVLAHIVETEMLATEQAISAQSTSAPTELPTPTLAPMERTEIDPFAYFRSQTSLEQYAAWIPKLSGEEEVMIGGQTHRIATRYSYAMFSGQENAKAKEYLLETIQQWIPGDQITVEPYAYVDGMGTNTWYNIIVTFPGAVSPEQEVLLTAHYDSCVVFMGNPLEFAPGANDNGTGVATLLEAIRIFSKMKFDKTLKLILFSGEENFQQGSKAYVEAHAGDHILGVINMDMYGTDSDGDRCFELYVGTVPGSGELATLFGQIIQSHDLNLKFDYLTTNAYDKADHKPFWDKGIPAVTAMENFLLDSSPDGCVGMDRTQFWHLPGDTVETINMSYAFDIGLAGTFTAMTLAGVHPVLE